MEGIPVFGPFGGEESFLGFVELEEGDFFAFGDGEGDFAEEGGVVGGVAPAEKLLGVGGFAAGLFDQRGGRSEGGDGGGEVFVEVAGEALEGALEAVLEAGAFAAGEFADPDKLQCGEDEAEQGEEADGGPGAEGAGFEILQIHGYLGGYLHITRHVGKILQFSGKRDVKNVKAEYDTIADTMITRRAIWMAPTMAAAWGAEKAMAVDLRSGGPYSFPPSGKAYRENAAAHRVWRRVLIEAPRAIVAAGGEDHGLIAAAGLAERRTEQKARLARAPREWMGQLAGQYGQELKEMVYTLSFSVWGRIRAGQIEGVRPVLEPFLDGRIDSLAKPTASHYSGHLTLAAWFEKTGDTRARDRVMAAARMARENPLHNEMSDSVFMVCPLLAKAGKLSGDAAWFDAALRHFEVMKKFCLRADGLYRHSPLDEAAWGRGNAFPLLGLALALSDIPASHPSFSLFLAAYRAHAARLLTFQSKGGCWRQVVDKEEAWEEYTATAMIGWALQRGLAKGWLKGRGYVGAVAGAWLGVRKRTFGDGVLVDVCESTGKQVSLADYLGRVAILGKDPRGGAMGLQIAAEVSGG